jgi:PIN domain nuclease of toxin-antitoxin system
MSRVVLDASAVLAILGGEAGADQVIPFLGESAISTVNLAEVHGKLVSRGVPRNEAWKAVLSLVREVIDFDLQQSKLVGELLAETHSLGLSLGDRACLALGAVLKAPVYTTDRAWKPLKVGVEIRVLRGG